MKVGTRKIEEWLIERDLRYDLQEGENGGNDFLSIPCSLEHINGAQIFAIIGDDDIQMGMLNFIKVSDSKKMEVLEKINELNSKYRWIKLQLEILNEASPNGDMKHSLRSHDAFASQT